VTVANSDVDSRATRVSVIGIGANGVEQAARILAHPDRWKLVSIIDSSVASYQRFQSQFHQSAVPFFRKLDQAVSQSDPDVVLVSTLAQSHIPICSTLIDLGFNGSILVEKPLSNDLSSARELQRRISADQWGGNIYLDYKRRVGAPYVTAHQYAVDEELGPLQRISASWRAKISMTGSHYMDLAMHISGGKPTRVRAELETVETPDSRGFGFYDPSGTCEVEFDNGVTLSIDFTGTAPASGGISFDYEKGSIFVDRGETYFEIKGNDGQSARHEMGDYDRRHGWFETTLSKITDGKDPAPLCDLDEGISALGILVGAFVSNSRGGEWIDLPMSDDDAHFTLRLA
jgi:predicted dehydrogenase